MRLVTFEARGGAEALGALFDADSRVANLAEAHRLRTGAISAHLASMQALIEGGPAALDLAAAALEQARRAGIELGRMLSPGDVVELEVEKIGILRNRIVKHGDDRGGKS